MVWSGIHATGLEGQVALALDVAATQFFADDRYHLETEGSTLTGDELATIIRSWSSSYPIVSVEDPFAEDDWPAWRAHAASLGIGQVIGDDLIATGTARLCRAVDEGCANTVLVKPNQAGSMARALDVLREARSRGIATVVSARSGDTEQDWLADLAVGSGAGQIKVGSLHRSERTAKWNRLLELESRFSSELPYEGAAALAQTMIRRTGASR
jgi:enolase